MKNKQQTLTAPATPWWTKYMPLLLCGLAFLVYPNTIGNGYNMDDELVTRKHKFTSRGISAIPEIFTNPYYSDQMGYSYEYRPVVLTTFAIEHQLFGEKPALSHFINVLLYVLTVYVLFRLLRRLLHGYSYGLTVLAVLLFALHPLHTEVVASIKNRDEILALLLGLWSWSLSITYMEKGKPWQLAGAVLLLASAMLSKVSIAPLAVFIPLSVAFFSEGSHKRILWLGYLLLLPVFLLAPLHNPFIFLPLFLLAGALPYAVWKLPVLAAGGGWKKIRGWLKPAPGTDPEPTSEVPFPFRWTVFPPAAFRELLMPFWLLFLAAFLGLSAYYLYSGNLVFLALALVAFAVAFWWGTLFQRHAALLAYAAVFAYVSLGHTNLWFIEVSLYFLLFLVYFRPGFQNAVTVAAFLILGAAYTHQELPTPILVGAVVFGIVRFRRVNKILTYARYLVTAAVLVNLAGIVIAYASGNLAPRVFFSDLISQVVLAVVCFPRLHRYFIPFVFVVLLLLIVFLSGEFIKTVAPVTPATPPVKETVKEGPAATALSPNLRFTASRPISYAEVPVSADTPLPERLGLALDVLAFYLQKVILPYPMGYYYGYAYFKPVSVFSAVPLLSLLLHVALLGAALWLFRRHRLLSFGILFYLASIVLFSGFLYPVVGVAGDRFTYLATLGWSLVLAYLAVRLLQGKAAIGQATKAKAPFTAFVLVLLLGYGFITLIRNTQWKDALTLMGNDIGYLDESAQAHNLYALNLMKESYGKGYTVQQQVNMRKLALVHFDRAVQIWPGFFNAAYDKGRAGMSLGDLDAAIAGFEKAVEIGPEPGFTDPYVQLTDLYLRAGRYPEYLENARRLFRIDPNYPEAYNLMAKGFYLNGNTDSAKAYLRKGIELYPTDQSLRKNMAEIFKNQGIADSVNYYLGQ